MRAGVPGRTQLLAGVVDGQAKPHTRVGPKSFRCVSVCAILSQYELRANSAGHAMNSGLTSKRVRAAALFCLALCLPSWAVAAGANEIATMKRAIKALQAENRALANRVITLEAERSKREQASAQNNRAQKKVDTQTQKDGVESRKQERPALPPKIAEKRSPEQAVPPRPAQKKEEAETQHTGVESRERDRLEQRVKELEISKMAQQDAVRSIIRSSISTLGSKINESVSLGGALQVTAGRVKDFSGVSNSKLELSTFELDLEIQANDWTLGSVVVEYVNGTDAVFPTSGDFKTGVDRINLDTALITIGDPQRFPPFLKAGRMTLPFGTSTGVLRTDVLSTESPLTIEAFEFRNTAIGIGFGFPTPALTPATPPVIVPPVKPMVINPLISSLARRLGYNPPPVRPKPLTPINFTPDPPPFNAGIYLYSGNTFREPDSGLKPRNHIAATAGFRTRGHCGRPYDQLRGFGLCPWSIDVDVDYNSSVFDSRFLEAEYRGFLDQIGFVPGMAVSVKTSLGPISLVAEWNSALKRAKFFDDLGASDAAPERLHSVSLKPSAWQLSAGYQFDWNPWVETIGAHGTFVAVGYSQSRDLAGATRLVKGEPTRVGFVPKRRLLLTAGEWVLDGVKLTVEYSRNWDYSLNEGGTGKTANGIFSTLTYTW